MTDKQIIDKCPISEKCKEFENCKIQNILQQLKRKEQECEELKKELHKNFEEKDTLHLIIDRLLEASGYDTNTASAEDFEDVYENMRYEKQQLDQLKRENEELKKQLMQKSEVDMFFNTPIEGWSNDPCGICRYKQTLTEIKEIAITGLEGFCPKCSRKECEDNNCIETAIRDILQKIIECEGISND